MLCPKCNSEIPDEATFCGICGEKLEEKKPKLEKNTKIILIVCAAIALLSIIAGIIVVAFTLGGDSESAAKVKNDDEKETNRGIVDSMYDAMYTPFGNEDNMPDGELSDDEKLTAIDEEAVINVLVLGIDVEAKLPDIMMLCQVDGKDGEVTIMSIPRDTKVKINGKDGKINSSYSHGGITKTIDVVEDITGVSVDYYAAINTKGFREVIDAVGGVYFDVPRRMDYEDPLQNLYIHLDKGYQLLDGDGAEQLIRFRQYPRGDLDRIAVQHDFLRELIGQALNAENIAEIPKLYDAVKTNVSTDMNATEIFSIGKMLLEIDSTKFNFLTLPGEERYSGEVSYYFADSDCEEFVEKYFD